MEADFQDAKPGRFKRMKHKIQWFLFPKGVKFEDGKFRSGEMFFVLNIKKTFQSEKSSCVDLDRIELSSPQCECGVLPLYYRPENNFN